MGWKFLSSVAAIAAFGASAQAAGFRVTPDWDLVTTRIEGSIGDHCRYSSQAPTFLSRIDESVEPVQYPDEHREEIRNRLNALVLDAVAADVAEFLQDPRAPGACSAEGSLSREASQVYAIVHSDGELLSVRFDSHGYWGGAHGGHGTAGLALNLLTGQQYRLAQIVSISALPVIKQRLRAGLDELGKLEYGWFDDWAAEILTIDALGAFTFDARGVTIHIPEYAVASYAAGPSDILVPWALLREHRVPGTAFERF